MHVRPYVEACLARPMFDPDTQGDRMQSWWADPEWTVGLSCNIGME